MIVLGLTGSIGMGKSTTAALFREAGAPVQDADQVVAALYRKGGAAVGPIGEAFPDVVKDGAIDRATLSERVLGDPEALRRLESIVHPLVRAEREAFLREAAGAEVVVFDVPLLLETGLEREVDAVVVATAPETVQRERVLSRPGMTEAKLGRILARQMSDADKRARADFVIDTGRGLEAARGQVQSVLAKVRSPAFKSRRSA